MVSLNGGLTVSELLRGMEAGRMQSVGIMQVIPLTMDEDLWDDRFVGPKQGRVNTDSGYGNLEFENPTDKTLLVPSHVGYVISQQGQDHAMSHAGMVKKKARKNRTHAIPKLLGAAAAGVAPLLGNIQQADSLWRGGADFS